MIKGIRFNIGPITDLTIQRGEEATIAEVNEAAESIVERALGDIKDELDTHENEFVRSIYPEIKKQMEEHAFDSIRKGDPHMDGRVVILEIEEPAAGTTGSHVEMTTLMEGRDAIFHLTARATTT